ncbi:acetylornithine/succinylornithine family transaminase [Methanocaldococcus infernus]
MDYFELEKRFHVQVYKRFPVIFVRGRGTRLWDINNKEYIDFLAGIGVVNAGHCNERVVEAIKRQAETLIHVSNLFYNIPQIELSKVLVELSNLDKVFFCNSGAEANEGAIKFVRKWAHKEGREGYIITMENAFHGRTLGALSATPKPKFQEGFKPLVEGFKYIPFNDIEALKENIKGAIAVMLEPIQGEGGIHVAEKEYLKAVRELCDDYNVKLIFDEVQCGMGRVGEFFAYQHYKVEPDIVTLAKALGNGLPIGAIIVREEIAKALDYGDHGTTFGGNPLACSAGLATVEEIKNIKDVKEKGEYFMKQLSKLDFNFIKEVRGLGLMIGLELTFNGSEIVNEMLKRGFIINCTSDKVLRFLPPLIVKKEEIDEMIENLKNVFEEIE